jgi:hypothetical protein
VGTSSPQNSLLHKPVEEREKTLVGYFHEAAVVARIISDTLKPLPPRRAREFHRRDAGGCGRDDPKVANDWDGRICL